LRQVSIVNPSRPKAFGRSELSRTKTDRADAKVIARFCAALQPAAWVPPAIEVEQLQALVHRLDNLTAMQQQEQNRLATVDPILVESITAHIDFLKEQIVETKNRIRDHFDTHPALKAQRDLLTSIPSIAETTATVILAEIRDLDTFDSADQLAAFAGLTPQEFSSGSSVHGKPRLSKIESVIHASVRLFICLRLWLAAITPLFALFAIAFWLKVSLKWRWLARRCTNSCVKLLVFSNLRSLLTLIFSLFPLDSQDSIYQ